MKAFEIV